MKITDIEPGDLIEVETDPMFLLYGESYQEIILCTQEARKYTMGAMSAIDRRFWYIPGYVFDKRKTMDFVFDAQRQKIKLISRCDSP